MKKISLLIVIIVCIYCQYKIITACYDYTKKEGIVDKEGNAVVDYKYRYISSSDIKDNKKYIFASKYDFFKAIFKNYSESVYIDLNGNEYNYESIPYYYENRAFVYDEMSDKYGYIDEEGNNITDYIYDYNAKSEYDNGFAKVNKDGKYGVIDIQGNEILPCNYDYVYNCSENFFVVQNDDENFLIDRNQQILGRIYYDENDTQLIKFNNINDLKFDEPIVCRKKENFGANIVLLNSLMCIKQNGKYFLFNENLKKVAEFDEILGNLFSNYEIFLVYKNNNKFLIDKNGNELMDCSEFNVVRFNEKVLKIEKDNKFGVIDYNKNVILNTEYDEIGFDDKFFFVKENGKYSIFDLDGNLLYKTRNVKEVFGDGEHHVSVKYDMLSVIIFSSAILLLGVVELYSIIKLFSKRKSNKRIF